ncbi:hypothetical protein OE88DRAFT_1712824 [Heliocybe sulcata]|uniref:Uncharacterized protein n=1 Tax=Heliocybe sulcata TaxID=5364 RepID=A0A5C3N0G1_9AGAM|nr:hypothetical protein OE88DRAFT_1712824 [Heliocybe sulcata]
MFVIESSLPTSARIALAATAFGTSGVSTALVSWVGKPYVATLRPILAEGETLDPKQIVTSVEMTTYTLTLKRRVTKVYDTSFLVPAERAFAAWKLAEKLLLTSEELENKLPEHGSEETIAETFAEDGKSLGRWIVKWQVYPDMQSVVGECHQVGHVVKIFNVHEELLEYPIR